jgi:hypothetical protein
MEESDQLYASAVLSLVKEPFLFKVFAVLIFNFSGRIILILDAHEII